MSTLEITSYTMPAASLGRSNPLPDLKNVADPHTAIEIDQDTVSPEESRYMGWGRIHTILPYTIQDGYNRTKRKRAFKAIVLENEHLKATFLPQLGGRLWSLFDKEQGRELLHVNPVFQPCNLALRNAWISGGVEWNVGIIGHTPFTVDDMACQQLTLSDGTPVLRMFQYERVRRLIYRIEAFLPDNAKELYVRVRIDNVSKEDTAVYWWSNMAVDEGEDIRVIVPAEKAFRYGYGGKLAKIDIPYMTAQADKLKGEAAVMAQKNGGILKLDISKTTTIPQAMDFFFDVDQGKRPYIAALGADGYGMCQTSTKELMGRKLFVWGMGTGGRNWQTFLAQKDCAYIELQSGLARTQLEHLPMKGRASISWLESYGPVQANPNKVHGTDWNEAVKAVDDALEKVRPARNIEKLHTRLKNELDGQNGPILHRGMGFAWAEKKLLGEEFNTAGLSLAAMRMGIKEQPWITLAKTGELLPCPDPLQEPVSYQIGSHWEEKLVSAIEKGKSDHWFAHYQLGVMLAEKGENKKARKAFEQSIKRSTNPWALRCLAIIDIQEGMLGKGTEGLCQAVQMKPIRPLVIEALDALSQTEQYEKMLEVIKKLPATLRETGRIKTYEILALMRTNSLAEAQSLLESSIVLADVREGDVLLTDLWFELIAWQKKGCGDEQTVAWARANFQPPRHLDFRMN